MELVHDQDNADALRRQLIMSPATQEVTVPDLDNAPEPLTSDPYLPSDADVYNDADIGTKYDEEGNIQRWYNMKYNLSTQVNTGDPYLAEFSRVILETQHWRSTKLLSALEIRDRCVRM